MVQPVSAREIAVSGLKAQRIRMNVIANNIANAQTTRTREGGPFRRQLVLLRGNQLKSGYNPEALGVRVKRIVDDPAPFRTVYQPEHPEADESGYVKYPNISLAVEMIDLVSAQRAYEANIAVFVSDRRMNQQALEIIRQ